VATLAYCRGEASVTDLADTGARPASARPAVPLPDRRLFWAWVWGAIRPIVGWVLVAAGTITLIIGWFGVSGESLTAKQLPYLVSAGLAGIALFIMAGVFLATDDVRRQFERITDLERKVDDLYSLFVADIASQQKGRAETAGRPRSGAAAAPATEGIVALPTGNSYHRVGCALVAGKDASAVTTAEVAKRGLKPCRVCEPAAAGR
jgi:hypothetical protein